MHSFEPEAAERKSTQEVTWWGGQAMAFSSYRNPPRTQDEIVRMRWLFGLEFTTLLLILTLVAVSLHHLTKGITELADLAALSLVTYVSAHLMIRQGRLDLSSRADLPSVSPQFSVLIRVKYAGTFVCRDEGMATLMEGYLMFEGTQVEFGIRSQDCGAIGNSLTPPFRITTKVERGIPLEITFYPTENLSTGKSQPSKTGLVGTARRRVEPALGITATAKFGESWLEWRQSTETEISNSTYPPIVIAPDPLRIAKRVRKSILVGLAGAILALEAIHVSGAIFGLIAILVGLLTFGSLATFDWTVWKSFDRRVRSSQP